MSFIRKLLGVVDETSGGTGPSAVVRTIVDALDDLPEDQATFVAAFAFILSRVANADMDVSDEETRVMEQIVIEHGGLPRLQANLVVRMAKTQSLMFGGTENFPVTQEFNRLADKDRKLALLDCLFAVSAADHDISATEDQAIHQISDELLLDHGDFIAVRSRYSDKLSTMKGLRDLKARRSERKTPSTNSDPER